MTKINLEIPGYIKENDLRFLAAIAQGLPEESCIIDVGCGWGREAWVLSKNAPASSRVFCLDIWGWPPTWKYLYKGDRVLPEQERNLKNSEEEFLHFTSDCHNITAVKADKKSEWSGPKADFIFYDEEDEVEQVIIPKLLHWADQLKPDGILCGTDFYPYSAPPVKAGLVGAVRTVARERGMILAHNTATSIWMMTAPENFVSWKRN